MNGNNKKKNWQVVEDEEEVVVEGFINACYMFYILDYIIDIIISRYV